MDSHIIQCVTILEVYKYGFIFKYCFRIAAKISIFTCLIPTAQTINEELCHSLGSLLSRDGHQTWHPQQSASPSALRNCSAGQVRTLSLSFFHSLSPLHPLSLLPLSYSGTLSHCLNGKVTFYTSIWDEKTAMGAQWRHPNGQKWQTYSALFTNDIVAEWCWPLEKGE